jgi:hypothetical protein
MVSVLIYEKKYRKFFSAFQASKNKDCFDFHIWWTESLRRLKDDPSWLYKLRRINEKALLRLSGFAVKTLLRLSGFAVKTLLRSLSFVSLGCGPSPPKP